MSKTPECAVFFLLLLLVSQLGSSQVGFPVKSVGAVPAHETFWLVGSSYWNWNYSQNPGPLISFYDWDTVTVMLKQTEYEGATHNWFLDFNNNFLVDPNEQATSSPDFSSSTQWANFTFTADIGSNNNSLPDYFQYRCRYRPTRMFGSAWVGTHAPYFSVTSNPWSITIVRGSSNTSMVTAWSNNNFSGNVTLDASVSQAGLSAVLNRREVTVNAGGTDGTSLTVSATSSTPTGTYNVQLTASNSTVSRTTQMTVTVVEPTSSQPSTPPMSTLLFAGIVGLGILILFVIALVFARHRKKKPAFSNSSPGR